MRLERGRRGRRGSAREDVNPMESVANLVDIMLVFICGLMIAIIMFWNVDLDNLQDRQSDSYEDIGQVYQDPETGKIYVVKPAESSDTASDTTGTAQSEDAQAASDGSGGSR